MKALICISVLFLSLAGYSNKTSEKSINNTGLELRDSITDYAQQFLGIPYKWGGANTSGFDCTGFVYFVFKKFGVKVSRASSGYENVGQKVDFESASAGDIMLFTGTKPEIKKVGHAGIVLKNENGIIDFIHSSSSKKHFGVTITRYNSSGYEKRFLRIINVLKRETCS